jgi:hypothetical protein
MKVIVFVSFIGLCEYNENYKLIIWKDKNYYLDDKESRDNLFYSSSRKSGFSYTVICKTSGAGFWAFYTPKRPAILLKNFMNKLNSAENFFTKLSTPRPKHLPTDWINSYKKTER